VPIRLTQDVKTVSELKKNLRSVLRQIRETGRPVIITVNGKPDAVLIDVETYERELTALRLVELLAEGEEETKLTQAYPASA
jgi:prevent-host-death family protein